MRRVHLRAIDRLEAVLQHLWLVLGATAMVILDQQEIRLTFIIIQHGSSSISDYIAIVSRAFNGLRRYLLTAGLREAASLLSRIIYQCLALCFSIAILIVVPRPWFL